MRWYRRWAEEFVAASKVPLRHRTKEMLEAHIALLGRQSQLADWQVVQAVDAIQRLLGFVNAPLFRQADWPQLRDSLLSLPREHATLARTCPPDPDLPAWKQRLIAAIRLRNYSIRTEQSYMQWLNRLCRLHRTDSPDDISSEGVCEFLERLVTQHDVTASTQNQALNAFAFYYQKVLERPL